MRIQCIALLISMPLAAQWLHVPTKGVPRNADGSPKLAAPAPRTANGKPDFSGMWVARDELPCDRNERGVQCTELKLTPQVINIANGLKDGLPYQPWAADLVKKRRPELGINDPHTNCMPPNYPRAWAFPEFQKILQTPDMLVVLHEFNASYRQIFTDGRALPKDPNPTWNGYSVGHWDGDTLVVDSTGFNEKTEVSGYHHTEALHVIERFRRAEFGNLQYQVTIEDPNVFTGPWTENRTFALRPELEKIDEFVCENNRDYSKLFKK